MHNWKTLQKSQHSRDNKRASN